MQDPYLAVREEVEHSVAVVIDLHKKWKDLSLSLKRGDEFEWTSSELLSGLRSIEWDLQDLEDTVSIVEGNRQKFQLEESEMEARRAFIESTRAQITSMRDEVQASAHEGQPAGYDTKGSSALAGIGGKGYGKVTSQDDELTAVDEDIEMAKLGGIASAEGDEILGMDGTDVVPRRHLKKKLCVGLLLLLLLAAAAYYALVIARPPAQAAISAAIPSAPESAPEAPAEVPAERRER